MAKRKAPTAENPLRALPAVGDVLALPGASALAGAHGREPLTSAIRSALDGMRAALRAGAGGPTDADAVLAAAAAALAAGERPGLCRVLNATGVVLHTGLGRAVLPRAAMEALAEEARGYCLLAMERESAGRGRRERFAEGIRRDLTGCEAATVVNNNAAATMLVLNTMAEGREAILSRGQLVEIGGSFRIPDVMRKSGVRLVEVGCTNRTWIADYRAAIRPETALLVRVHPSNYRIEGFAGVPGIGEICALGRETGVPVFDDLGAGALLDVREIGLPEDEPRIRDSLAAGCAVVTCSADKLIGGPQGGLILGTREWVDRCEANPLMRSLRVGKLDLIALEATLRLFRDRERLLREHPTMRMLSEGEPSLARRAEALAAQVRSALGDAASVTTEPDASTVGSGAAPVHTLPTRVVAVHPARAEAGEAARRLRLLPLPLFLRVKEGALLLDPRTLQPGEEGEAVAALASVLGLR